MNISNEVWAGSCSGEKQMRDTTEMKGWLTGLVAVLLFVAGQTQAMAATLDDISFAALPGDNVQLRLTLSETAPQPGTFTIDNPARIALDLPDTSLGDVRKSQSIGIGVARGVQAVEAGSRTRVVINLARLVPYMVQTEGNVILVTLGRGESAATASDSEAGAESATSATSKATRGKQLTNVDFRRGDRGDGRVLVDLSSSSIVADITEEAGKIVVEFLSTGLPENLERRLNVVDFATPVTSIDTFMRGSNVRMEITAVGDYQHLAYQTGQSLTIEVQPVIKEEAAERKSVEAFTGEKLSLNFQNIEVRAVLQLLADFTGLNLVTSDSVKGNVTLRLKNVPWDQALDIIMKARGLGMRRTGDVIMVAPNEEIAAREKLELEASRQIEELAPLYSDSIQINYAKALDLAVLLKSEQNSLLSGRGSITIDERTNKLLVRETQENLTAIRRLVAELDVPVRQVLIETRVVLATDAFNRELGARFGVTDINNNNPLGSSSSTVTSGNLNATTQVINGETIEAPDRWNVDLPVESMASSAASIGLALIKLPFGSLVELELSAAQAEGQTEVVSSPRVITANQKEAVIEQGVEIPYQQASSSGATNVTFKKAVLSLRVTPQITPDDRIIMDLKVNKDSPDYSRSVLGQPPINTQQVQTQVLVENGETIVLGGVYEQNKQNQIVRVPFLSDIPLLGYLFRRTYKQDEKSELLIFVSPKIVKESTTVR
jgi:type IV pilus assembly protein PilQ